MARFDRVYTDTQKAAIARAAVDEKRTGAAIVQAAREGQLSGLKPFRIPLSTVYDIARKERARRRQRKREPNRDPVSLEDPAAAATELRARVLAFAHGYLDRAWKDLDAGKLEPAAFKAASRTALDIAAEIEKGNAVPEPEGDEPSEAEPAKPATFLQRLAEQGPIAETVTPTEVGNEEGNSASAAQGGQQTEQPPIATLGRAL
jgi:hypothetical protein